MSTHSARRARVAAVALLLALVTACQGTDGQPGAPRELLALLEQMPASVVDRGFFYSDLTRGEGFGTALPSAPGSTQAFGFQFDDVSQILETGGAPLTLLRGQFEGRRIEEGFIGQGYASREEGGWLFFERSPVGSSSPFPLLSTAPFTAAVPAAAFRSGTLVLGAEDEVGAVVADPETIRRATDLVWPLELARSVGRNADAVALAAPPDVSQLAERLGVSAELLLDQATVTDPLPTYLGYALAHTDDEERNGVLVLAFRSGEGGTDVAADVIRRLATSAIIGEPTRRFANDVEPAGPRWFDEPGLVRMPLTWREFVPERVRGDVEAQRLGFLVPRLP